MVGGKENLRWVRFQRSNEPGRFGQCAEGGHARRTKRQHERKTPQRHPAFFKRCDRRSRSFSECRFRGGGHAARLVSFPHIVACSPLSTLARFSPPRRPRQPCGLSGRELTAHTSIWSETPSRNGSLLTNHENDLKSTFAPLLRVVIHTFGRPPR